MKKLLILIVVLGMASMANATLQISVNGDPEPINSEIIIPVEDVPSGILTLDIWTDADILAFENVTWALIVDDTEATISGGVGLITGFNVMGALPGIQAWAPDGMNGSFGGYLGPMVGPPVAGTVLYDDFLFHCEAAGDATIELWELADVGGGNWALNTLVDSVVVHQIPEPMTMVLLGLGGLFLRRRK